MPFNRIAVYSHRGWVSSEIVKALAASGAYIRVLYRPGSDILSLPGNVDTVEVDLADHEALIRSLQDIDIVISLVGHDGVTIQHHFIAVIPKTNVQLFSPSDLASRYDALGLRIPLNKAKREVEEAAHQAGIPTTIVLTGNFAEFALGTRAMGVDCVNNKMIFSGDSATLPVNLCTRPYVAAAYASIFASTPIDQLKGRFLALSELRPTGNEIAAALTKKFNRAPLTASESTDDTIHRIETELDAGSPFALAHCCRKIWGNGQQIEMVGDDIWDVEGYAKSTIDDLIVGGHLSQYRALPAAANDHFAGLFNDCK